MSYEIISVFRLSDTSKLIISTRPEQRPLYLFSEVIFTLVTQNREIILYDDFICEGLKMFTALLKKAINGQLVLERSLCGKDLGLICNEYYHEVDDDNYVYSEKEIIDDFIKYQLWEVKNTITTPSNYDTNTWLYNHDNEIMLEVTPLYPHHCLETCSVETYNEFIKQYTKIEAIAITKEAPSLLQKCTALLSTINCF